MNCKNCGFPLEITDRFCKNCGTPVDQPVQTPPIMEQPVQPAWNQTQEPIMEQPAQTPPIMEQSVQPAWNNQAQGPVMEQPVQTPPMMNDYSQQAQQPSNNQPFDNMPSKKSNPIGTILIILLILGFLVGGYFGVKYLLTNVSNLSLFGEKTTDVVFNDYTFKVPTKYNYEVGTDTLFVGDKDNTWNIGFMIMDDSVDIDLMEENSALLEALVALFAYDGNVDIDDVEIEIINEIEMITFKASEIDNSETIVAAIIPIDSENSLYIYAARLDKEYDTSLILEATKMVEHFVEK